MYIYIYIYIYIYDSVYIEYSVKQRSNTPIYSVDSTQRN